MELFFDLVFVVAVAQLGLRLHGDYSARGILVFGALFVPVWWVWLSYTYYADLFDTDDIVFRISFLAAMLASLGLATALGDPLDGRTTGFVGATFVLRAILVSLWAYARRHDQEARGLANRYLSGFSVGATLWLVSLVVPAPVRFGVWALAMLIELATPLAAYVTLSSPPRHSSHLPERIGLFTIIVLGESIVAVTVNTDAGQLDGRGMLIAGLGFVVAASLWWTYFDHFDEELITRAITSGRRAIVRGFFYGYGHLMIFAGLTAAAIGVELAIQHAGAGALPAGERAILCGGVALVLITLTAINTMVEQPLAPAVIVARLGAAGISLIVAAAGGSLRPPVAVTVVAAGLLALTVTEILAARPPPGRATAPAAHLTSDRA